MQSASAYLSCNTCMDPWNRSKSQVQYVLIEFVMLKGINDSLEDAHRCCKIHLHLMLQFRLYA